MSDLWKSQKSESKISRPSESALSAQDLSKNVQLSIEQAKRRESFLERFFPDIQKRAVVRGELALIEREYTYRKELLEKQRCAQIQEFQEACNQYLIQGKAAVRGQTYEFFFAKSKELEENLNTLHEEFMRTMEQKHAEAEATVNPKFRQLKEDQIDSSIIRFSNLKEDLLNKFKNIIEEGV
jgi:hypothetical protein